MYLFTLGYENQQPESYVKALIDAGVRLVVDVRENPWSQRPAYVGGTLRRSLEAVNIGYSHRKLLGNPARIRKTARTASQCLREYRAYLNQDPTAIHLLLEEIRCLELQGIALCLTCYERDPNNCHRSVIVDELVRRDSSVQPIHLQPEIPARNHVRRTSHSLTRTAFLRPALLPFTFE